MFLASILRALRPPAVFAATGAFLALDVGLALFLVFVIQRLTPNSVELIPGHLIKPGSWKHDCCPACVLTGKPSTSSPQIRLLDAKIRFQEAMPSASLEATANRWFRKQVWHARHAAWNGPENVYKLEAPCENNGSDERNEEIVGRYDEIVGKYESRV